MNRILFFLILFILSVGMASGTAQAQPAAPNPVSPQGAIAESSPDFTWAAVPDALFYLLFVQDTNGVLHSNWHSATDAGCDSGAGNCTINPALSLDDIPKEWAVMAWNNVGTSPLSVIMSFFVGAPHITSAVKNNQSIEINGTHLHTGADPTVNLGGTALTVTAKNPNGEQVTAELPPDAESGAYELTVAHENGTAKIDFNLSLETFSGVVLKDANGDTVGNIVDMGNGFSKQYLVRFPVVLPSGETKYGGLVARHSGPNAGVLNFAYESNDCSGTPYVFVDPLQKNVFYPIYLDYSNNPGDPMAVYAATTLNSIDITSRSIIWGEFTYLIPTYQVIEIATGLIYTYTDTPQNSHGYPVNDPTRYQFILYSSLNLPLGCKPENPRILSDMAPAELVDPDFLTTHPPPYTLELQ